MRKQPQVKSGSVLVAVRNGEAYLEQKLQSLLGLRYPAEQREILVLSDGSTDGTDAIAVRYAGEEVKLLRLPAGGKAVALNAGMEQARGEILFFTDVRQPLEPDTLQHLVDCFADDEVGVVSGELIIREGTTQAGARVGLYWKYEKWIRRKLSDVDSILGATGGGVSGTVIPALFDPEGGAADGQVSGGAEDPVGAFLRCVGESSSSRCRFIASQLTTMPPACDTATPSEPRTDYNGLDLKALTVPARESREELTVGVICALRPGRAAIVAADCGERAGAGGLAETERRTGACGGMPF